MSQIILLVLTSIFATVGAQLCFKQGVSKIGEINFSFANFFNLILKILQNGWLLLGMVIFGFSFVIWLVVISKLQLNIVYPISVGAEVTLATILSWLLFREYLAFWQILGIVLIIFGIFLILKS